MESEKVLYWMTLGVLAMAMTIGFVTEHRGWGDRLADRSIAIVSQASERARNYVEIASLMLGSGDGDSVRPLRAVVIQNRVRAEVQNRLACTQQVLARRQAEMIRLQAMRMQVRMLKQSPPAFFWSNPKMVIEVPQPPQVQVDTF
jgi:hypothetical protein